MRSPEPLSGKVRGFMADRRRVRTRLFAGVSGACFLSCLVAMPAAAQTVSTAAGKQTSTRQTAVGGTGADVPQDSAESSVAVSPQDAGDVVVTGSRVIRNGNNSPSPVTIASTQDLLETQPNSVVNGLNTLPGLLGSLSTTSNVNSGGYNTINLRGVGTLRALVLYDGHRVGPTQGGINASSAGAVNVDVIPQMLLQRVDVVTGGASAVYGSDAVSGVVNFITDTKFNGFKANLQSGISTYGDDRKINAGVAYGRRLFDDRGHVEFSYEFRDAPGFGRAARRFFDPIYTEQGSVVGGSTPGTAGNPFKLTTGAILATSSFGGLVNTGPLSGLNFTQNGILTPFVHGTATGTSGVEIGGDGAYYTRSTAGASQRVHQAFGRFDYDLTDDIRFYAQGAYTHLDQAYTQQNLLLNRVAIGYNNAYLSTLQPQYQTIIRAQLAAAPAGTNPSFLLSKLDTAFPNFRIEASQNYYMAAGGLKGKAGRFDWSVDYYHTDSRLRLRNVSNIDTGRLYAALNGVVGPTGQIVCNAALVNPSVYGGCIPLNVFGPTSESAAAIAYIQRQTQNTQRYTTNDVSGTLGGALFSLPAGPVNVALNGEYRKLTYSVSSNATPSDPVSCTGVQFNCTATTAPYLGGSTAIRTPVKQEVAEGAIEADIPILANVRFVQAFNINGAARYTHYDTSGSVATWKVGATWKVDDAITLRATRSRDIRAPNLTDLFAPATFTPSNYLDLHTNTSGLINRFSQGNSSLRPEKADTLTAGVVLRPGFIPGFSLAVDYYRIEINQAIVIIDPFQTTTQATCEASGGTSPVCALYIRPLPFSNTTGANYPTQLVTQALNVASVNTEGVDFEANYDARIADRALSVRALVNWQPHLRYNNGPNGIFDIGGAADGVGGLPPIPSVKVVASAAYEVVPGVRLRVQERWRSALRQNGAPTLVFADGKVPSVAYTDATLTFNVNAAFSASLNVQNLFDKDPPPFASTGGSVQPNYLGGYAQGDDIEGRFITFGVKLRL